MLPKRRLDDIPGLQHVQVERYRQAGVEQNRLPASHRVLIAAERGKAMDHEILQHALRLGAADWKIEVIQPARVVREQPLHHGDCLARGCVRFEVRRRRYGRRFATAK